MVNGKVVPLHDIQAYSGRGVTAPLIHNLRTRKKDQTGPEAHPAPCTMGTGSFPGVRCCRGVMLTPHPPLVQRS